MTIDTTPFKGPVINALDDRMDAAVAAQEAETKATYEEALADLRTELDVALAKATTEREAKEAVLADFAEHMKLLAPAGHPLVEPPPVATALLGASYGTGASKEFYRRRAQTGRLYFEGALPTDPTATAMFKLAYGDGVRHFLVSYRGDQGEVAVGNALSKYPSDCSIAATWFHEPENNIKDGNLRLADWRARNIRDAKIMRDIGITPVSNLMQYTLSPKSGRNVADYFLDGAHELMTFDYYMNPDKGKDDPEGAIDRMVAAALEGGAKGTGLGEHGIPNSIADSIRIPLIKRSRAKIIATPEVRFAQFWSSGAWSFNEATANAWFEGR